MALEEGAGALMRAWQERPTRAEPLYALAKAYREAGQHDLAWLFASKAATIRQPESDILFVEDWVYSTGIDHELSITGFYVGENEKAMDACERLLANPRADHALTKRNQIFYTGAIEGERASLDALIPDEIRTFDGVRYWSSNPSVCDDVFCVRLVNYQQERGRRYWGHPNAGIIRTKNALIVGGKARVLDDSILDTWNQETSIFGLEDLRLVKHQGRFWFSATCCQVIGASGCPQVVLGRISSDLTRVEHLVPLKWSGANPVEKNWLLFSHCDELRAVYSFDPFTLLTGINAETGDVWSSSGSPTRWFPGRFRGSAPPIKTSDSSWLALVHDVANFAEGNVYTHRFIAFDAFGVSAYSDPFFLEHAGIEYACGMTERYGELVITYGFEDREAKTLTLTLESALEALHPWPYSRPQPRNSG